MARSAGLDDSRVIPLRQFEPHAFIDAHQGWLTLHICCGFVALVGDALLKDGALIPVGNSLICSVDEAGDFETKQDLVRYFEGEVVAAKDQGSASSHVYSAEVFAVYTPDGGTLSTYVSKEQVLAILKLRKVVVCKFRTAAYSYGSYYSESMDVPASAFIQAIQHKQAF